MLGVSIMRTAGVFFNNHSVANNNKKDYVLNKKHSSTSYHSVP